MTTITNDYGDVLNKGTCFSVGLHLLGTKRKIKSEALLSGGSVGSENAPDPDYIHVSKDIIQSPALKAVRKCDGAFKSMLRTYCLPFPIIKDSMFLVPDEFLEQLGEEIKQFKAERSHLVQLFLAEYIEKKQVARKKLGAHYKESDYPPVEAVEAKFAVETDFIEFGVPGKMKKVAPELFNQEIVKMKKNVANATEELQKLLRYQLSDLINHMVERLESKDNGSHKTFHGSLIGNMNKFLETFAMRNFTNDQELAALVEEIKALTMGISPKLIKDSDDLRLDLKDKFEQVKAKIDPMVIMKPKRKVLFQTEGETEVNGA